jgi:4'-phosphopantetheinyl transferase
MQLNFIDLSTVPHGAIAPLLEKLPPVEKNRLLQYHQPEDRLRGVAGRLLLQNLLQQEGFGEDVLHRLKSDAYLRPYINDSVDFNVSHSGHLVVAALSRHGRIGIDVEEMNELEVSDFDNFFTATELHYIRSGAAPMSRFYELWTKKEAVMKANGKGMHLPVREIILHGNTARCEQQEWQLVPVDLHPRYACHVAMPAPFDGQINAVAFQFLHEGEGYRLKQLGRTGGNDQE